MELLAGMPPPIVRGEPRYQQWAGDRRIADAIAVTLGADGEVPVRRPSLPIWHLDGVDWHRAPAPPKQHEHWAQTVGHLHIGEEVWRCPCGAMGGPARPGRGGQVIWIHLNPDQVRVAAEPGSAKRRWWRGSSQNG